MLVVARGPFRERLSSGVRSYATKKSPKKVPLKIESPVVHETRESLPGGNKVLSELSVGPDCMLTPRSGTVYDGPGSCEARP